MAGLLKSQVQLGDSAITTQNFVLTSAAQDGTMKLSRGNYGATTQDVIVVDTGGKLNTPLDISKVSMVRVTGSTGYGSLAPKVRRFVNIEKYTGVDIKYVDSDTAGASFIIQNSGVYAVTYVDEFSTNTWSAVTINCGNINTDPPYLSPSEILVANYNVVPTASNNCNITTYIAAGSILRAQVMTGYSTGANNFNVINFTIIRVA